jgi:undecaprenyl diphosphate synthase
MFHVAVIMDGNGRWAARRGLPRTTGHRQGAEAVRRTLEAAPGLGITDLTVYAFSADNWKRPRTEVDALMRLLVRFLRRETERLCEQGVRFTAIGRRDRLDLRVRAAIEDTERLTRAQARLHFRVAIDYSARDTILQAAAAGPRTREEMSRLMPAPEVDLLIRTAGEQRLSDFLLWESAYAEFWFTSQLWPDFSAADLAEAVQAYRGRERRFGGLPAAS